MSFFRILIYISVLFSYLSCKQIDIAEKNIKIPKLIWNETFSVQIPFKLSDTTHSYKLYFIVKHINDYKYKNLWITTEIIPPEYDSIKSAKTDSLHKFSINLNLANNEKGWLGSGMGNTYEQRVFWNTFRPKKKGIYHFHIRQIMRDSSLHGIVSIGLRIEK